MGDTVDRTSVTIPAGPNEVTAAWLGSATGWDVQTVELRDIGTGLGLSSAVYRAVLTGTDCPSSAVIKLAAADPESVFTAQVLHMYTREVRFFERLADQVPMRVPEGYFAQVSDDGTQVVVVMEDLGGCRPGDQVAGLTVEDATRCIEGIADWHAQWWRSVDGLAEDRVALSLGDPVYPAMLPGLFADGWQQLLASERCQPPVELHDIGERFGEMIPGLLQQLNRDPVTLLHGDFRGDNVMFDAEDRPVLIDFQLTHTGSPVFDLAYFITQSLDADLAKAHEAELVGAWRDRVLAAGVPAEDLDHLDEDYSAAALMCLVYPVVGARGSDLDDPRTANLVNTMVGRMARAVADHAAAEAA